MSEGDTEIQTVSVPATAAGAPPAPEPKNTAGLSVLIGAIAAAQNAIFPAIAASVGIGWSGMGVLLGVAIGLAIVVLGVGASYLRWKRLTYTVGAQDIRVESGILSRAARSVPYERIQDVSLEQKLIPRLFGLVSVKFETGAGGGEDLALAYLTEDVGEELRQLVRERRDAQGQEASAAPGEAVEKAPEEEAKPLFEMGTGRLFRFGIFEFSLAVFAVLGGLLQYAETLFSIEIWNSDLWRGVIQEQGDAISSLGVAAQVVSALSGLAVLLLIGSATGMIRVFLREWGFLLERTARGFRRRRGLLTKTDVVMPIHRVQGIKIGTRVIRYRFGWHNLNFVSLAQDAGSSNHVVAPFAKMDEIEPIVETAGFHLPDERTDWHHASANYRTDSMIIDSMFFFILALAALIVSSINGAQWITWGALALMGLGIFSAGAALYSWQFKRHALDDTQIMARAGLMSPQSQIATRLKLHSVEISQGPIARWRGYATLHLGQAGGEFSIPGVPIERARDVRRKVLETIASTDFSELEKA